jgi:hypothetical protein
MMRSDDSLVGKHLGRPVDAAGLSTLLALAVSTSQSDVALATVARDSATLAARIDEIPTARGRSSALMLGEITNPDTPLDALRNAKDFAKDLADHSSTPARRAAATLLYHAAIAAALVHRGESISSIPIELRFELYEDLASVFAGDPLGHLFRRAADRV